MRYQVGPGRLAALMLCTLLLGACGGGSVGKDNSSGGCSDAVCADISLGMAVGDFNGDRRVDLAIAHTDLSQGSAAAGHPSSIHVTLRQTSGANYFGPQTAYPVGADAWNTVAADVDGDGHTDIVSVSSSQDELSVLLNDPAHLGTFKPAITITSGPSPFSVVVADVNQDGHPDLIECNGQGITIHFQSATISGSFGAGVDLPIAPYGCEFAAVADINGDGLPDIVAAVEGSPLVVFLQDPAHPGSFQAPITPFPGNSNGYVTVADLNGDLVPDVIYGVGGGSGPTSLLVALGDPAHPGSFQPASTYSTINGVGMILVADLDGDGRPDIVTGAFNGLTVYLQDPSDPGHFMSPTGYGTFDASNFALTDVDGDGHIDVVLSQGPSLGQIPGVLFQDAAQPGHFGSFQDLH
jgi:hypothetical protein